MACIDAGLIINVFIDAKKNNLDLGLGLGLVETMISDLTTKKKNSIRWKQEKIIY